MGKHSGTSTAQRRLPRQERGERRVTGLLDAAAAEFQAVGYDAATMSSIARRARASIGSLYQFFPNKESVARELRTRLGEAYDQRLAACMACAGELTLPRLVEGYVGQMIGFVRDYPAILPLLDAPSSTRVPESRRRHEERIAGLLRAHQPRLGRARAGRLAMVVMQINKSMLGLYMEAEVGRRRWVIAEFKGLLMSYLGPRVGAAPRRSPRRREGAEERGRKF